MFLSHVRARPQPAKRHDAAQQHNTEGTRAREVISINVNKLMAKHGLTDSDLDRMAAPYEEASFKPEPGGKVYSGSHLDAVGKPGAEATHDAKSASPRSQTAKQS